MDTSIAHEVAAVPRNNDEFVVKATDELATSAPFAPQVAVLGFGTADFLGANLVSGGIAPAGGRRDIQDRRMLM